MISIFSEHISIMLLFAENDHWRRDRKMRWTDAVSPCSFIEKPTERIASERPFNLGAIIARRKSKFF